MTFKKPISSMSVSGHKFIGCPIPCGVQITRKKLINALSRNEDHYCASTSSDATILGSRNIHAPLFMWYTLNRKGYGGFWKDVWRCLQNARYLKDRLREAGFGVMLNELSTTVVFERPPNDSFVRKWQLACLGNVAHVVVMPSLKTWFGIDPLASLALELLLRVLPRRLARRTVLIVVDAIRPKT